jgi:hypothetical protein
MASGKTMFIIATAVVIGLVIASYLGYKGLRNRARN